MNDPEMKPTPNMARLTRDETAILSMLSVIRTFEQDFVTSFGNHLVKKGIITAIPSMFVDMKSETSYFRENTYRYPSLKNGAKSFFEVEPSVGAVLREDANIAHKRTVCRYLMFYIIGLAERLEIEPSLDNMNAVANIMTSNDRAFGTKDSQMFIEVCNGLKKNPKTRYGGYWASWVEKAKSTIEEACMPQEIQGH